MKEFHYHPQPPIGACSIFFFLRFRNFSIAHKVFIIINKICLPPSNKFVNVSRVLLTFIRLVRSLVFSKSSIHYLTCVTDSWRCQSSTFRWWKAGRAQVGINNPRSLPGGWNFATISSRLLWFSPKNFSNRIIMY